MSDGFDQAQDIELGWPADPSTEIEIEVDPHTPLSVTRERASTYSRSVALRNASRRQPFILAFLGLLTAGTFLVAQVSSGVDVHATFALTSFGVSVTFQQLIVRKLLGVTLQEGPVRITFNKQRIKPFLVNFLGSLCGSGLPLVAVCLEAFGPIKVANFIEDNRLLYYTLWIILWLLILSFSLGKVKMERMGRKCALVSGLCFILGLSSFCASYMLGQLKDLV